MRNRIIWASFFSWGAAQLIKIFSGVIKEKRFDFRWLLGTGGMPSAHSAGVSALATAVGLYSGFYSITFAITAIFALIIMFDAQGLRRMAGRQAVVLNQLMEDIYVKHEVKQERLIELIGAYSRGGFYGSNSGDSDRNLYCFFIEVSKGVLMRKYMIFSLIVIIILIIVFSQFKPNKKVVVSQPTIQSDVLFKQAQALKLQNPEMAVKEFEKIISQFSQEKVAEKSLLEIADIYKSQKNKNLEEQTLAAFIRNYPGNELFPDIQKRLWQVNMDILFSPLVTEHSFLYEVQPGDSLYKIAKNHNTTVDLIMKSNNLKDSLINPGMKLKIEKSVFSIEVIKSEVKLVLKANGEALKVYPIGIGANNSTPVGEFKITNRIIDPVWYKTGAIVPAGSEDNILGTRWLGISEPGYGIHGTVDKQPITQQQTQGCVRMINEDVEELFIIIPVGTQLVIRN
ncbi:MAG: divergent PAP2 family protein [Candidatus Omnitrophota bacterium]